MATTWRLLRHDSATGAWNMAVDEAVARAVGAGRVPPTLRFYDWSRPTISLGYLQSIRILDAPGCRRFGLDSVRRPTGGRAILHHHEVTWSLALPLGGGWGRLSVPERFRQVAGGLVQGLGQLGVEASVAEAAAGRSSGNPAAACFRLRGMPAILSRGRKLAGAAERRWERALLQHGSVLLDFDAALHAAVFPEWAGAEHEVSWLAQLLAPCPTRAEIVDALAAGLAARAGVRLEPGVLTTTEAEDAAGLVETRYGSPAWTGAR